MALIFWDVGREEQQENLVCSQWKCWEWENIGEYLGIWAGAAPGAPSLAPSRSLFCRSQNVWGVPGPIPINPECLGCPWPQIPKIPNVWGVHFPHSPNLECLGCPWPRSQSSGISFSPIPKLRNVLGSPPRPRGGIWGVWDRPKSHWDGPGASQGSPPPKFPKIPLG